MTLTPHHMTVTSLYFVVLIWALLYYDMSEFLNDIIFDTEHCNDIETENGGCERIFQNMHVLLYHQRLAVVALSLSFTCHATGNT